MAVLDDWERVADTIVDWPAELPDVDVSVFHDHVTDQEALATRLEPFDVVMVMRERTSLPRAVLERLPALRLLVTTGMRNRALDVEAAHERGITVCGTDAIPWAAPELTWALILGLARRLPAADAAMRDGRWEPSPGLDLHGATLGLVGLGRLGTQVAKVAHAFDMDVVAWSPHLSAERAHRGGARLVGKHELFATSDVVSVHMVLSARTHALVGADEIAAMKPTAYLVNTSRGALVDQAALLDALTAGRIAGAGLDVYDEEPLPVTHPLRSAPRTLLTPHLGYVTRGTFESFYRDAVEDVRAFLDDHPVRALAAEGHADGM